MAALNRPETDRGQLILVTGLTIAVILVALVVLLNTVIYTENLATRGVDAGGADAIEYRATVVGAVGELIAEENEQYNEGELPVDGVGNGIGTINETLSERHLTRGAIAEVRSYEIAIDETSPRIWQHESGNLTANDGESDWMVATNVTAFERFVITVDSIDEWAAEGDNERLRIIVDDSEADPWTIEINASEDSALEVVVNDSATLTYDEGPVEINIDEGRISNETTSDNITAPTSADTIEFRNGNTTTGTFELHSDGTPNESNLTEYDGGSEADPYYTYTVESVDLVIHYETAELRYTTEAQATVEAGEST